MINLQKKKLMIVNTNAWRVFVWETLNQCSEFKQWMREISGAMLMFRSWRSGSHSTLGLEQLTLAAGISFILSILLSPLFVSVLFNINDLHWLAYKCIYIILKLWKWITIGTRQVHILRQIALFDVFFTSKPVTQWFKPWKFAGMLP